ncbi:hypothetical protein [Sinomicrobium weinanense]|uniref:Uncharacterized protein n=1 Tax=Sinomicrobium weinanense TaxID=2842200 RepID=A0A926Q2I3_9FLAO|nr:hypothetical protein [Sinomicrobium weinanense]MBC9795879.1 hypothetical protein [Sinomicrobium weinanense]MBU3125399.1 hypothetical protein [Sinomicrobium weinanense]
MQNLILTVNGEGFEMLLYFILAIMFGPPVLFAIIGILFRKRKTVAKVFYILAAVYLVIGLGLCGSMML